MANPSGTISGGAPQAVDTPPESSPRRTSRRKDALRRRLLCGADLLCFLFSVGAMTLVEYLVEGAIDPIWALAMLPLWALVAKLEGLYDADHPKIWHRTTDEAHALFHWITLSVAGTLFFLRAVPDLQVTVDAAVTLYVVALASAFLFRAGARTIWRRIVPPERALVIGDGKLADAVTRKLALEPGHHLSAVEHSTLEGGDRNGDGSGPELRLEDLSRDDLEFFLDETSVERVVLALPELDEDTLARVVSACSSAGVKLSVVPPMRAMLGTAVKLTHIAEMPVIEYGTWDTPASTLALKRAFDIAASAFAILLLCPAMVVIALAIRLDSRGPAFFRQLRAGRGGQPFLMVKFRTMCHNAQHQLSELVPVEDLSEPMFKIRDDPRVTRIGRFLRRTSLDELPQLFNVLRGDMSIVGPRPEEVWLVERYGETERFRLAMRPGLTGPMQVHGRGELGFQERLAVEREYVENYGLRKDVQILLRTASVITRGDGAY